MVPRIMLMAPYKVGRRSKHLVIVVAAIAVRPASCNNRTCTDRLPVVPYKGTINNCWFQFLWTVVAKKAGVSTQTVFHGGGAGTKCRIGYTKLSHNHTAKCVCIHHTVLCNAVMHNVTLINQTGQT